LSNYENPPSSPLPVRKYLRLDPAANYLDISPDLFRSLDIPKCQISTRISLWAVEDIDEYVERRKRDNSANITHQTTQGRNGSWRHRNTGTRQVSKSHGATPTGRAVDKLLELKTKKPE
jgi:hypothetical protein